MENGKVCVTEKDIAYMNGPYPYTKEEIQKRVREVTRNGNYRTGILNQEGNLVPKYTGRGVVYDRLVAHLDEGFSDTFFMFIYIDDELDSYCIESADYHYFGKQLRNAEHPKKPDGKDYLICPYCEK